MPKYSYSVDDRKLRFELETQSAYDTESADMLAELAAEHFHSEHDGWEAQWPKVFTLFDGETNLGSFDVECEAVPSFSAFPRR